ncbi:MAG: paraquat-inducible protein A [Acetobacteraceae bacterium]
MSVSTSVAAADPAIRHTPRRLRECHDCGLLQAVPALAPGSRASCLRCDALLRQTRAGSMALPLALNMAALVLFFLGAVMTLMSVRTAGQQTVATLLSGPAGLEEGGLWELGAVVVLTTFAIPLARVLCILAVLPALRLRRPPGWTRPVFAWAERLRPWSMIEIYLLGAFVAYVKLSDMVQVDLGIALFALVGLMVMVIAADASLDDQAVWEAMERQPPRPSRLERSAGALGVKLMRIGCHTCGLVSRASPGAHCPRCGFALRHRKRNSVARSWALLTAAALLYLPANIYPVMTVIRLGHGGPSTIIGGVQELLVLGMWPLALLVFVASIAVPLLKLLGMALLLIGTQRGWRTRLKERTVLYRVVDLVGRWSMIDIFMVSILVAVVQFGAIAMVQPGLGATAFAAVVILTMFAAEAFDPRLMWDAAAAARPAGEGTAAGDHP